MRRRVKRADCPCSVPMLMSDAVMRWAAMTPERLLSDACWGLSSGFEPPLHTSCDQVTDCAVLHPLSLLFYLKPYALSLHSLLHQLATASTH
ncbi:MAG: hypothetical protein OCU16_06010 [Candidatus Methanospirare jalkutatii]|nr:hypothetical protein [Candidatus Methanospirare jalkutatii]